MDLLATVLLVVVIIVVVVWPLTFGRRFFVGEKRGWPAIRRDLFGGSYDEGMYPLDPGPKSKSGDQVDEK